MRGHRVTLLEDDPWRAESLRTYLARQGMSVDAPEPEVVLLALRGRSEEMKSKIEAAKARHPGAKIVAFVPQIDNAHVFPCLLLGVKGILSFESDAEQLKSAIKCVLQGSIWTPRPLLSDWIDRMLSLKAGSGSDGTLFTKAEQRVLDGVLEELSNKEIARRLSISEATVKFHVGKLLRKTGTKDRRDLARFAREALGPLAQKKS
jgi:DNA-binding NarL/FixJ family response regulator